MNFSSTSLKALAAAMLLVSTTGIAVAGHNFKENYKGEAPCPPPPMLHDGFYVGATVGYNSFTNRFGWDDPIAVESASFNMGSNGWLGGGLIGYGMNFSDMFYIGVEGFGNGSGGKSSNYFTDGATTLYTSVKSNSQYGVTVLPGVRINPALLAYVRVGYNWANFKGDVNLYDNVTGVSYFNDSSSSKTVHGWAWGLGAESLVMDTWSVRSDYTHTRYQSRSDDFGYSSFRPTDNQYSVSLIWHFA